MAILAPSKRDTPHKKKLLEKYKKLKDNVDDCFSFDDNLKKKVVVIDYDTDPASSSSDDSDQDDETKIIDNKESASSSYNSTTNDDGAAATASSSRSKKKKKKKKKPQHDQQHNERQLSLGGWDAFNLKDSSLKPDMLFVAEALHLDLNTKTTTFFLRLSSK